MFRADWNSTSNLFITKNTWPTHEIYICPWWSVVQRGISEGRFSNSAGSPYVVYSDTYGRSPNITWPVFVYISAVNMTSVTGLNLMEFVKDAAQRWELQPNVYVVGAEVGVRLTLGRGIWTPLDLTLTTITPVSTQWVFMESLAKGISWISSTPNIMVLVKSIRNLLFMFEEYSYYLLSLRPNKELVSFYELCWNCTWTRWRPGFLNDLPFYSGFSLRGRVASSRVSTPDFLSNRN